MLSGAGAPLEADALPLLIGASQTRQQVEVYERRLFPLAVAMERDGAHGSQPLPKTAEEPSADRVEANRALGMWSFDC